MTIAKHFDYKGIQYAIDVSHDNKGITVQVVNKNTHQPINGDISYKLQGLHYSDTAMEGKIPEVIETLVDACESDFKRWDAYNSQDFLNHTAP